MAEQADAPDLGSGGATRGGSTPPLRKGKKGKKMKKLIFIILVLAIFSFCRTESKLTPKQIREPSVAGMFYPGNKKELNEMLQEYLSQASKLSLPENEHIVGLIVPHAGYIYSGRVAAKAYKQIEGKNYDTVIILGVAHRYQLRTPSIYPQGYYKTPLGLVEIDNSIANELMNNYKILKFISEAHKLEHSIEVQLPFLQTVLKNNFKIVPILLGHFPFEMVNSLAHSIFTTIKSNPSKKFLIIASSDFSHYPVYKDSIRVDKETIKLIKNFKIKELIEREKNVRNSGIPNLVTYQCGLGAITTLMLVAEKIGAKTVTLIDYKNSGDTSWLKERVVGYVAMSFSGKNINQEEPEVGFNLTEEEKKFLLQIARKTLTEYVRNRKTPAFEITNTKFKQKAGAFVTLTKNHNLRGCIGYILPVKPLYQAVIENTINACSRDFRFLPVTPDELDDIEIEISVLSPPVPVDSYNDIILGKHGIILKKGLNQAVFLPQVAPEQGWDLSTTLTHLSLKAGLDPDAWKSGCKFKVFTAIVFSESEFK